ncbi:MAG: aspartate kinase [Alphaproteobacteria bacterium]|nr:aspartate kinase [Alphaproteobacteria bacterium]
MACIVQKFGGTSVATLERIKHVAELIAEAHSTKQVAVVVSAMAGVTNKFVEYAQNLGSFEGDADYDSVVSSGELVTAGLLAITLKNMGLKSRSYAGWQIPIETSSNYGSAIIQSVDPTNLEKDLREGIIPVICGFQGISSENRITTLGRGGSDLTAVAVSDALKAELCEIYSDVDGVYTVDPNLYPQARRIDKVHYNEMKEMAALGAKVLQEQSVDYAMKKNVRVRVASSFVENEGTTISSDVTVRKFSGLAITQNLSQLKICHKAESHLPIIELLEQYFIRCEVLKVSNGKFSILIDRLKIPLLQSLLSKESYILNVKREMVRKNFSRVSVIGSEFTQDDGEKLISVLREAKIEVFYCSIRKNGINLIVLTESLLKSIDVLHKNCGLGI